MAIHYKGPLLGDGRSVNGLCREIPMDIVNRRDYCIYFNDFLAHSDFATGGDSSDTHNWIYTDIGTPASDAAALVADSSCGELLLDAGGTSSTGFQAQLTTGGSTENHVGEFVVPADGKIFAWEARVKVDTVANGGLMVGLLEDDTTAFSSGGAVTVDNGLYFVMADGGVVTVSAERATNITSGSETITMTDDTYITLGMRCSVNDISVSASSGSIEVYVNGIFLERLSDATNGVIPNAGLALSFGIVNDAANDIDGTVDYIWVATER